MIFYWFFSIYLYNSPVYTAIWNQLSMPIDPSKPYDLTYKSTPTYCDMRLDQFVKAMVPSMSRTKIQKYIKDKRILVNGDPKSANWKVRLEDEIVLCCKEPEANSGEVAKSIPLDIIHEDDDLIAINKQPGLIVHPVGKNRHNTLLNALYWRYKDILPTEQEISLCNRLDQYTSGVILVSKHAESKRILQDQFENRKTKKIYLALCEGILKQQNGEINEPLGPSDCDNRTIQAVRNDSFGKPSLTRFELVKTYPSDNNDEGYSLVRLYPHTGRQHQLRVHMAFLGHPMVCDKIYGDERKLIFNNSDKGIVRYALHAEQLTFMHPSTNRLMTLDAPLAEDIADSLELLDKGIKRQRTDISDE